MTPAILIVSTIAALAAVASIAYQLYARRPAFALLGGPTNPDVIDFILKNIGTTAARRVSLRARVEGEWYEGQQGVVPILVPDQTQSFSCRVPNALHKDREGAIVAVSYTGAFGRQWTRTLGGVK